MGKGTVAVAGERNREVLFVGEQERIIRTADLEEEEGLDVQTFYGGNTRSLYY